MSLYDFELFSLSLVLTIIVSRIWNIVLGNVSLYLFDAKIHHAYIGILLILFTGFSAFYIKKEKIKRIDLTLFGIGTGLILDEFTFLVFTPDTHPYYFKDVSVFGVFTMSLISLILFYTIYHKEN